MANSIKAELKNLVNAGVVSQDTANDIETYFAKNEVHSHSKLFVIFGIIGAILCGLGIILILAHNWDDLSVSNKLFVSFLPLVIGQFFCGFSLFKKNQSVAWLESSAVFLFFAIGSSISLVAQIYNISGDFDSFMLTWSLLALPIVYCLRSSTASMLYIVYITIYCCHTNYFNYPKLPINYWYFLLILGIVPHYYHLLKTKPTSNFTWFHNWFFCLSILISIGVFATNDQRVVSVVYASVLAIFYFKGKLKFFELQNLKNNSYYLVGKLGTIFMLFLFSFQTFWPSIDNDNKISYTMFSIDVVIAIFTFIVATALFILKTKKASLQDFHMVEIIFLVITIFLTFEISMVILSNILILLIGMTEIKRGNQLNNFGVLNYGLAIITMLIICRFFDTDFSFIIRGLIFVFVGCGFFFTNYLMLKKRKYDAK